jgi:hypothetical protein
LEVEWQDITEAAMADTLLPNHLRQALEQANAAIASNAKAIGAYLADICQSVRGHEKEYLCHDIEPSLQGATVIAGLFREAFSRRGHPA